LAFNSIEFLLFLGAVTGVHWLLPRRLRPAFLLAASYAFYALWSWRWLWLLLGVTAATFATGLGVAKARAPSARRAWLCAGIAAVVGCLLAFKGAGPRLGWLVPVGLSYYAFMGLGYMVDVYRGAPACRAPLDYALFLAFFPQVLAGPIERAGRMLPQIRAARPFDLERFRSGCFLVVWGLFQKVFVADNLAMLVDRLFDGRLQPDGAVALLGVYAFALQLYADFAGYSDVAVGVGRCLGFELVANFERPFLAADLREFWRRWHISLTSWFTDYLYRPLLAAPLPLKLYLAPFLTMVLMGLWHGFTAPMAAMGVYYGLILAAVLAWRTYSGLEAPVAGPSAWLGRVATFHLVAVGFMLMRVPALSSMTDLAHGFLRGPFFSPDAARFLFWLAWFGWPVALAHGLGPAREGVPPVLRLPVPARAALYLAMFYAVMVFGNDDTRDFIYLQF
jgi:alginate O-acetyltransferase complex protein AlgI